MPDATGSFLVRVSFALGEGTIDRQRKLRRLFNRQRVARPGEHRQALQRMKAIGTPLTDMQEQVDLGGCVFGYH
jgi:hypothetical protein